MHKSIAQKISKSIEKGEHISPFLFLWSNLKAVSQEIDEVVNELQDLYHFPNSYVYRLNDNGESIKIAETRVWFKRTHVSLDYPVQIFIIEKIGRLGIAASNSLLKVLEEPGAGNVIFLTNSSESWVLDTVLSRIQKVSYNFEEKEHFTEYLEGLISDYVGNKSVEILGYFFWKQFEKQDGALFLYAIIELNKKTWKYSSFLPEIQWDLDALANNNINSKFVVDKYLLLLRKWL